MQHGVTEGLPGAHDEKRRVAITSVVAAVVLTGTKIVVGLATGSLGILSEAAHSALDLVAALMTVFAVRASAKPADADHPYGHGKFENLSALFETILLLVTCIWIIREAVLRLFFHEVAVETTVWSFAVIVLSIAVDVGRSRALMKVAKKHGSAALEADALHFSTDVWSSSVVLFGLAMVFLARFLHAPWLVKADSVAALAVAGIVAWVSIDMGRKTMGDLLDTVPPGMVEQAGAAALAVPGVEGVLRVRMRKASGEWFSDIAIQVGSHLSTEESHQVADAVEEVLSRIMPGGDVVVHVEPKAGPGDPSEVRPA
ncbi:MAG TPA: cation diffusion facilitator family transporter [Holophaga sp.]|nr:cation diffusion facilitator family transporter [Holophaga sp.]